MNGRTRISDLPPCGSLIVVLLYLIANGLACADTVIAGLRGFNFGFLIGMGVETLVFISVLRL